MPTLELARCLCLAGCFHYSAGNLDFAIRDLMMATRFFSNFGFFAALEGLSEMGVGLGYERELNYFFN